MSPFAYLIFGLFGFINGQLVPGVVDQNNHWLYLSKSFRQYNETTCSGRATRNMGRTATDPRNCNLRCLCAISCLADDRCYGFNLPELDHEENNCVIILKPLPPKSPRMVPDREPCKIFMAPGWIFYKNLEFNVMKHRKSESQNEGSSNEEGETLKQIVQSSVSKSPPTENIQPLTSPKVLNFNLEGILEGMKEEPDPTEKNLFVNIETTKMSTQPKLTTTIATSKKPASRPGIGYSSMMQNIKPSQPCSPPPTLVNGKMVQRTLVRHSDRAIYYCNPGFHFENGFFNQTLECINGKWPVPENCVPDEVEHLESWPPVPNFTRHPGYVCNPSKSGPLRLYQGMNKSEQCFDILCECSKRCQEEDKCVGFALPKRKGTIISQTWCHMVHRSDNCVQVEAPEWDFFEKFPINGPIVGTDMNPIEPLKATEQFVDPQGRGEIVEPEPQMPQTLPPPKTGRPVFKAYSQKPDNWFNRVFTQMTPFTLPPVISPFGIKDMPMMPNPVIPFITGKQQRRTTTIQTSTTTKAPTTTTEETTTKPATNPAETNEKTDVPMNNFVAVLNIAPDGRVVPAMVPLPMLQPLEYTQQNLAQPSPSSLSSSSPSLSSVPFAPPTYQYNNMLGSCNFPPYLPNGGILSATFDFENMEPSQMGDVVIYKCNEGFFMDGIPAAYCKVDEESGLAQWTKSPICTEAPRRYEACGPPPHLANALIKSRSYSDRTFENSRVGDYVNYACQPGYSLTGFNKVMCHSDGTWASAKMNSRIRDELNQPASSLPTCQLDEVADSCNATLPEIENAHEILKSYRGDMPRLGDYVIYECDEGYWQSGRDWILCTVDNKWEVQLQCRKIPVI